MNQVAELLKEASLLDEVDRTELVSSLLEELNPLFHDVSDAEALNRRNELLSGKVKGLDEDEFWQACGRANFSK